MKEKILTGWTFTRVAYAGLGITIAVNAIVNREWVGALLGGYFASMGIFAFGCAAGNCSGGSCNTEVTHQNKTTEQDVEYEEIKQK